MDNLLLRRRPNNSNYNYNNQTQITIMSSSTADDDEDTSTTSPDNNNNNNNNNSNNMELFGNMNNNNKKKQQQQQQYETPPKAEINNPHHRRRHRHNYNGRSIDEFLSRAVEESRLAASGSGSSSSSNTRRNALFTLLPQRLLCRHQQPSSYPYKFYMIFVSLGVANSSDASEILCLSYILSQPSFRDSILYNEAWRGGVLAAAVFMGMLIGGLIVGALGDWQGRKPLLLVGLATNCTVGFTSSFASSVWILAALRLIAGIGIGATVPPLFTLCSELSPQADRGFWVTVAASFWMVGSLYVAIVGWWILGSSSSSSDGGGDSSGVDDDGDDNRFLVSTIVPAWRIFAAVCAVPSAIGWMLVYKYVPESPRFLALQGYYDDAVLSVKQLGEALNYKGLPLTKQEIMEQYDLSNTSSPIMGTIEERGEENGEESYAVVPPATVTPATPRQQPFNHLSFRLVWYEFWTSASELYIPELIRTTLPLQLVWFSLSFGSYGLLTWINTLFEQVHLRNVYFNALLFSLANLPGNLFSAYLMDRTGRARLLVGSLLAAAVSLLIFAYVAAVDSGSSSSTNNNGDNNNNDEETLPVSRGWIVFAACSFQCFSIASWNAVDVLTSELFPTTVRATGMGICAASGRVGAMIAQGVNGSLVSQPVRLLLVAACTLIVGAITPTVLPKDATGQAVQDRVVRNNNNSSSNENFATTSTTAASRRSSSGLWQDSSSGGFTLQGMNNDDDVVDNENDGLMMAR